MEYLKGPLVRLVEYVIHHRTELIILTLCICGVRYLTRHDADGAPAATVGAAIVPGKADSVAARPAPSAARPGVDSTDVLWLARVIYSETKLPHEQELVAWVVRNRVETRYRGKSTYRDVVLDPWQFSAFNRNSPKRRYYASLDRRSNAPGFQRALQIARRVAEAPDRIRPFPEETRHFYSERSMVGRRAPRWAANRQPVSLDRRVDPRRFRFFAGVY